MEEAKKSVNQSLQKLYEPSPCDDPHYLIFEPFDSDTHGPLRERIFSPKVLFTMNNIISFDVIVRIHPD
jgi:hypothetical protein